MAKKAPSKGAKSMDKKQMKQTKGGLSSFGSEGTGAAMPLPDPGVAACAKGSHIPKTNLTL